MTELLTAADDRFVLCGPGDEVTVRFDAARLPPLPAGLGAVVRAADVGLLQGHRPDDADGRRRSARCRIRAMPNYPYDPAKNPPPAHVAEYDRTWNTRPAGRR